MRSHIRLNSLRRDNSKMPPNKSKSLSKGRVTGFPFFKGNRRDDERDFISKNKKLPDWIIALKIYFLNSNMEDAEKRQMMFKFVDKNKGYAPYLLATFLHPAYNGKSWDYIKARKGIIKQR